MGQSGLSQKKRFETENAAALKEWRQAIAEGNEKTLIRLLEAPQAKTLSNFVIDDRLKRTALHVASLGGHHNCVSRLLTAGASVKVKDGRGQTALMLAASRGREACVEALLNACASANAVDMDGQSPLHLASGWRGETGARCVERLLADGACVNAQDCGGWAPLHWSCREGVVTCVELLLKHGADVNIQSNLAWTPLHEAAREGHTDCVRILLEANASPHALDTTLTLPLIDALQERHLDCARLMLLHGASSNGPAVGETSDKRPLHLALKMNYIEAIELLFDFGADPLMRWPHGNVGDFQSGFDVVKQCNHATKEVLADCCWRYNFSHNENNRVRSLLSLSRIAVRKAVTPLRISRAGELGMSEAMTSFIQYKVKRKAVDK